MGRDALDLVPATLARPLRPSVLARYGYGILGCGEPFTSPFGVPVASLTSVLVDHAVARTCFSASFLLREAILRGYDAARIDLRARIHARVAAGEAHPVLAVLGPFATRRSVPFGTKRLDPSTVLGETPWSVGPRPCRLRTRFAVSFKRSLTFHALCLGVSEDVVIRHALALGWSVVCDEIELLLEAGFRPAYLFESVTRRARPGRAPWKGPRRQPLYGLVWMRRPGFDLSYVDPVLTQPDPTDPLYRELD